MTAFVLLAHGSSDSRAITGVQRLACAVQERAGCEVLVAFLDHEVPDLALAVRDLAAEGETDVLVVPLLLAQGHHARVDVPTAVAKATRTSRIRVAASDHLGVPEAVLEALATSVPAGPVVLAAAGTSDDGARAELVAAGERLSQLRGDRVVTAFAAGVAPTVVDAIIDLEAATRSSAHVISLVLFDGAFHDRIRAAAGPRIVTGPLVDNDVLIEAVLERLASGVFA